MEKTEHEMLVTPTSGGTGVMLFCMTCERLIDLDGRDTWAVWGETITGWRFDTLNAAALVHREMGQ